MFMKGFGRFAPELRHAANRAAPPSQVAGGLVAGTMLETACGWRGVESLTIGDRVQTLDGGLATILGLDRRPLRPLAETAPVHLPGGVMNACSDLWLTPGQHVVFDTLGDAEIGAPYAMLPALALTADPRIRRDMPPRTLEIVTPLFADEEVVYANSGVLLHCPGLRDGAGHFPDNSFFFRMGLAEARDFLTRRAEQRAA